MNRQPWWPENLSPYPGQRLAFGDACIKMDGAWRGRIEELYEGPYPDFGDDRTGLLDWFVVKLLEE